MINHSVGLVGYHTNIASHNSFFLEQAPVKGLNIFVYVPRMSTYRTIYLSLSLSLFAASTCRVKKERKKETGENEMVREREVENLSCFALMIIRPTILIFHDGSEIRMG